MKKRMNNNDDGIAGEDKKGGASASKAWLERQKQTRGETMMGF
jgi:hypothetical protein